MYMHLMYLVTSIGCSLHIVHDLISPLGMAIHLSCSIVTVPSTIVWKQKIQEWLLHQEKKQPRSNTTISFLTMPSLFISVVVMYPCVPIYLATMTQSRFDQQLLKYLITLRTSSMVKSINKTVKFKKSQLELLIFMVFVKITTFKQTKIVIVSAVSC